MKTSLLSGYGNIDRFEAELDNAYKAFEAYLLSVQSVPETTGENLKYHMERAGWNSSAFERRTQLHRNYYSRIMKHPRARYQFRTCLAVAVGLGMNEPDITSALRLSGMGFDNGDPAHVVYRFLLSRYPGASIEFFNAFCEKAGVPTLGSREYMYK